MVYRDTKTPLKELIIIQQKSYKNFRSVHCKILKQKVIFNAQGFEHLHMDGRKKRRTEKDARARLFLMDFALEAIQTAYMMKQDIKPANTTRSQKREVYYELYAIVGHNRVAVVVTLRMIGKGKLHFYGIRYKRKKTTRE